MIERRTIREIVVRYELEPELKDVYVEGSFDVELISGCLRHCGQQEIRVYDIGTIDISYELLARHGLTEGNKQRVIVLAAELAEIKGQFRCLVDKDLDHWFGNIKCIPRLHWTAYCSLELHFLAEKDVKSMLVEVAKIRVASWDAFFSSFVRALSYLYALRLADRELNLNIDWVEFDKCLRAKNGEIEFDLPSYIDKLIHKNRIHTIREGLNSSAHNWTERFVGDYRNFVRGHDLIDLMAWCIRNFNGLKELSSSICIERTLVLLAVTGGICCKELVEQTCPVQPRINGPK